MEVQPNTTRLTDDELIEQHLADRLWDEHENTISHAGARVIAQQYHGGMSSALYAFVSTGRVLPEIEGEVEREFHATNEDEPQRRWLSALMAYTALRQFDGTADIAFDGWHRIWLRQPGGEL